MQETINLVSYGVDTLIINVRYSDSKGQPVKQELDEKLLQELDYLQGEARRVETGIATDWAFQGVLLFVEPHGAGKQWRWLLTSRLLNVAVSRGKFNDIIAQVRFSSEYLWSQAWCGDALCKVLPFSCRSLANTFTCNCLKCIFVRMWSAMTSLSVTMKRSS